MLPLLARLGATGILIEYEDMFPYDGPLASIAAANAYSKDDIRRILDAAKVNNLIVIPLIQTFGHLEFILKLGAFKHLREVLYWVGEREERKRESVKSPMNCVVFNFFFRFFLSLQ